MLKRILKRMTGGQSLPDQLSYEQARHVLEVDKVASRKALAKRRDVSPEMLYFLADDASPSVRRHVAANPATPVQANRLLADDQDDDVRVELARKIARLLPDLDRGAQARLREQTVELLDKLAGDQLPGVRRVVAEEIKHADNLPREIIKRLAMDIEHIVCVPILEYSPLLGDDDLREIIATTKVEGALPAIARRDGVSEPVSDSIAATLDIPAVAALLANSSAQIREDTLDHIVNHARGIESWHKPMVMRPSLSVGIMRRIAGFVASSLVDKMVKAHDLDDDVADDLLGRVRDRLKQGRLDDAEQGSIAEQIQALLDKDALDDARINQAIDANQREFVIHAAGQLAGIAPGLVTKMINAGNGLVVTALSLKAGLTMRTALRLQREIAHIPPARIVNAKHGVDYPFGRDEMTSHLSYFGA